MARARATTPGRGAGFTLIELLVVISIVALLLAIALPAIGRARQTGANTRESAAIRQTGVAFAAYASDARGSVLPGFLPLEWVTPGFSVDQIRVFSNDTAAAPLEGSVARRYPWRLAPYLGYSQEALVVDRSLRSEFSKLPDSPMTRDGFQWMFAQSPSFGMNTTWVGGDQRRGGFHQPSITRWGKFYVTKVDEPRFPDKLLVFATSRGYHPVETTRVIPGRHRIEGPWRASREINQVPTWSEWDAPEGAFDRGREPSDYGHVDFRHFGRAAIVMFDGHVESVVPDDLSDMRRWSNLADRAGWRPQ
ncbi:MAG TPA: prepilin-type N-terminal cleavage/methylation domain-containing protein [Phycisphaerales bacterium]|nr:prepilin-type N-terminal cleavage/methylation domain-containing protein [Phycisphaerales bacterium]